MAPKSIMINYIEYCVSNIEQSKKFYGEIFGLKFIDYGPQYCEFFDGQMKGGFTTEGLVGSGGLLVVLYHENLEVLLDTVLSAEGQITKDIFQFPGGERFEFKDPDGYDLAVWKKL